MSVSNAESSEGLSVTATSTTTMMIMDFRDVGSACFRRYLEEPSMVAAFSGKQAGKQVVDVACGSTYSAVITAEGALYTWGRGNYGRLGHGRV